jgi:starch phosphorylase
VNLGINHENNTFNMTHLALNLCGKANGVSKLHGHVSREMFRNFYGPLAIDEVPISSVTNGVHLETWMAPEWKAMLDKYLPAEWTKVQHDKKIWDAVDDIPAEEYWNVHADLKHKMVKFARENLKAQARRNGESEAFINEIDGYLNPTALTIGFARRFATYKRATLMFNDLDRLDHLVNNEKQPVQFIFAGKAHPADIPGQQLIKHIHYVSRMDRFKGKIMLLENYDMNLARFLVQGVDVWLNNPKRPLEASGTSGQKVALNGGLNFSILDGWWEEGYNGQNGWSIDTPENMPDGPHLDQANTHSLYSTLENEIVPTYYTLTNGVAKKWIERSKNSVKTLSSEYNTSRMVADYTNGFYVPTIERAVRFADNDFDRATKLAYHKQFVRNNWHHVTVMTVEDNNPPRLNADKKTVKDVFATVFSGWIEPQDTVVELVYYEDLGSHWKQVVVKMDTPKEVGNHLFRWRSDVPAHLTHGDQFTIRVRPFHEDFSHPYELHLVTST